MIRSAESGQAPTRAPRVPVEAEARIRFEDRAVVEGSAANISLTGMFVRTRRPRPAGTPLRFELELSDGARIAGAGEVVWSRPQEESEERPAGMGILFFRLDGDGRDVISSLVERHVRRG